MKGTLATLWVAGAASLVLVTALHAGGWAIVSVRDLPEYAVAGTRLPLTFMVRQHGVEPLGGLDPTVAASSETESGTVTVGVSAVPTTTTGEYRATLILPRPGRWTIRIDTRVYGESTLHELLVIASGDPAPLPLSQPVLGERLFVAKGCIGCHVNGDIQLEARNFGGNIGPELTGKRFADAYLKSLLADPTVTRGPDAVMPDLGLTSPEIAALTAFINRERPR